MGRQITIYCDSDVPDLKTQIGELGKRRNLHYYKRSESAIAALLLQERLDQLVKEPGGGEGDHA